jgi:hypothetical protein
MFVTSMVIRHHVMLSGTGMLVAFLVVVCGSVCGNGEDLLVTLYKL